MTRISGALAALSFLLGVPATIWLAFVGHDRGLYSYNAIPVAFGLIFAVVLVALFALLPAIRRLENAW